MNARLDLDVPYAEKDEAKSLGAWWDPYARTWYVPAGRDPAPLEKWLSTNRPDPEDLFVYDPPVYVVESVAACWKCGTTVSVATLASKCREEVDDDPSDDEQNLHIFSGIRWLPRRAISALREVNAGYRRRYSKTAGEEYFMNHCPCGAPFGDFFLHSEPGGAFSPDNAEQAALTKLHLLSEDEPLKLDGRCHSSSPCLIWDHAQRD